MREIIKSFKVLSDETRLRVLNLIVERECCVCEIMQALNISQSKASRALSALHAAGFLKQRREGLWSLYSLATGEMAEYQTRLVATVRHALAKTESVSLDQKRLKSAKRTGITCVSCAPAPAVKE